MRIAAIGDLHVMTNSSGLIKVLLEGVEREADVLVLAGDLTNIGLEEEMAILLDDLKVIHIPIIAVVGNHDHENDNADILVDMMRQSGICVLECSTCEIDGVGFVGTKGFCGGFGRWKVETFGERALKSFVQASIDEAILLDTALSSVRTDKKVAILHYSPTRDTLKGEAEEIYPFLGTSRLAEILEKYKVDVAFHGHAHHGSPRGHTQGGVLIHNVARFVQTRFGPKAYYVHEI